MAKILYLGNDHPSTTSSHRANALRRLGHVVKVFDIDEMIGNLTLSRYLEPLHFRTGYSFLQNRVTKWTKKVVENNRGADLIWVNSGDKLGPRSMRELKKIGVPIVLYNNDDPTGGRDGGRFNSLIKALPYYDLCAVMRETNVDEFKSKGAKNVMRVWMSYDEILHKPYTSHADIPHDFKTDIVFIGTWMRHEKRDEFLLELIRGGLGLSIYGDRWKKSTHFKELQPYYKGKSLSGSNYVAAIQGAKICLGLLSKGNRDLHTQRSLEVPFAGGLLCAERTSEHLDLYEEGKDAVFWSDAKECIKVCRWLIDKDSHRKKIVYNGMQRVRSNKVGNEDVCEQILKEVESLKTNVVLR
ncbi:glycosyltransferase [Mucilaginibacter litoreus]|uniref:Glycosyltransferase n=1 Tax=Mucilaginibacter litoreus TaxID=1048221 RepID=A0ABW3AMA6_9SPHI